MNGIVNKLLFAGDTFMIHFIHIYIYLQCLLTTYKKQRENTKIKEAGHSRYIYQNELDKPCFQHGMAYGDFKYLTTRAASDKILRDKTLNIATSSKYDGYQCGLASMVYNFFDKKLQVEQLKRKIFLIKK